MALAIELINPFLKSFVNTLNQFGVTNIKKGAVKKKERLESDYEVNVVVGIVGDVKGNVTYNFSVETAKNIATTMMMGMEVTTIDEMAKSAISEMANMITGGASGIYETMKKETDISPPTLIIGQDIKIWISQVETLSIEFSTDLGIIELNIGLEV
ncbi:MAG: chemotaxis protein CheX [Fusobacteria bacterium]|jgi:chemotaxis protein CheX|nr:chemotaxis protein CheX [Fusobacteriota bacterium]